MRRRYTRRQVCATGLLSGAGLLAGCLGSGEEPTPGTVAPNGVVRNVRFDGGDLVVEFREDHDVSQVNLIDPDGELFTGTSVARGETTSRLQLLDIREGLGGYEHYEPGTYRLVAIHGETETTVDVVLQPELRIVDVEQYRDGERNADYGKLAVTVENVGTGPTWVYDITYRNAPNYTDNDPLISDPGIPRIHRPKPATELIIEPRAEIRVVSMSQPFLFIDSEDRKCDGQYEITVRVGIASGSVVEQNISTSVLGKVRSVGSVGHFACSEISVELDNESLAAKPSVWIEQ